MERKRENILRQSYSVDSLSACTPVRHDLVYVSDLYRAKGCPRKANFLVVLKQGCIKLQLNWFPSSPSHLPTFQLDFLESLPFSPPFSLSLLFRLAFPFPSPSIPFPFFPNPFLFLSISPPLPFFPTSFSCPTACFYSHSGVGAATLYAPVLK